MTLLVTTPLGTTAVQPGDFAAVRTNDAATKWIAIGEWLNENGPFWNRQASTWEHAITYVGGPDDLILEAEPSGAKIVPMHYLAADVLWSTVNTHLNLTDAERRQVPDVCNKLAGTPYSAADYFALATHRLHIPAPGLRKFVANSGHMICSQMVDYVRQLLHFQLFDDGRWNGFVTPYDIGYVIENGPQES